MIMNISKSDILRYPGFGELMKALDKLEEPVVAVSYKQPDIIIDEEHGPKVIYYDKPYRVTILTEDDEEVDTYFAINH